MTQTIDPEKLKAAAEHLEWVLHQYPQNETVQGLLKSLEILISSAKSGLIKYPVDSQQVPGSYNFSNGDFIPYEAPNLMKAYSDFIDELRGGLTSQDLRILASMQTIRENSKCAETT